MTDAGREGLEQRVLFLAPTERDATLMKSILEGAGVACDCFSDMDQTCDGLDLGAGVLLLSEESIAEGRGERLVQWLADQPPWSDLPLLILARPGADSHTVARAPELLGNVTVLERPMQVAAMVSAVRSGLRARLRQYQIRDHLLERELAARSAAILAAIVASSDDAIVSKTLDGDILTWNEGAERLFGYSASEIVGRPIVLLIPPERRHEEVELLRRLRRGERIDHFETIRVTKDGRRVDISLTVSPIRDIHGRVIGASKVARDITQRKQAEAALREADRRKDEFLAVLAHELRNPLAPIRNSLHILRLGGQNEASRERVVEMIERQVNHMVRLVDDLLEVSRITRGKIELRRSHVHLDEIVRSAVETSQPLIEVGGHHLTVTNPAEPLVIDGDSVRLAQVLSNLLNNSAKYTDAGGKIWLTVRRERDEAVVSIRDTGRGISSEMLPRVFEMFAQIDRDSDLSQGGLGIGLTLAKSLVELHGGTIQAKSAGIGRGSEFVVRLPLAESQCADLQSAENHPTQGVASHRFLVVDDNRDAGESLGMLLRLLGANVLVVESGLEALRVLKSYNPDIVLLDIGMPNMDGYEVARRIRRLPEHDRVTLIALTGWGQEEDRRRSRTAGFDHHLTKPTDVDALQELLGTFEKDQQEREARG